MMTENKENEQVEKAELNEEELEEVAGGKFFGKVVDAPVITVFNVAHSKNSRSIK